MSINTASHQDARMAFICAGYGLPLPKSLNNVTMTGMALSVGNSLPGLPRLPSLPGLRAGTLHAVNFARSTGKTGQTGKTGRLTISVDTSGNRDRKSTRLNSSHANISYAFFCLNNKITSYK